MADMQKVQEKDEQGKSTESKPGTSDDSQASLLVAGSERNELANMPLATDATTPKGSGKTLSSPALEQLTLRVGLLAGALSDFECLKQGRMTMQEVMYPQPSGTPLKGVIIILSLDGYNLTIKDSDGFREFEVLPLGMP